MCHVLPTTLLCAALDHSFHSFSLSLCPNHNKVYIFILATKLDMPYLVHFLGAIAEISV